MASIRPISHVYFARSASKTKQLGHNKPVRSQPCHHSACTIDAGDAHDFMNNIVRYTLCIERIARSQNGVEPPPRVKAVWATFPLVYFTLWKLVPEGLSGTHVLQSCSIAEFTARVSDITIMFYTRSAEWRLYVKSKTDNRCQGK